MNKSLISDDNKIKTLIYEIRGKQVMLDADLARLYQIETANLKRAVRRNIERFPENFMFQLTREEFNDLTCQFGISNEKGGTRWLPFAFTEQGVAMLSGVLHTETAVRVSVQIINAFVAMRHYISSNLIEQKYINDQVMRNSKQIDRNTELIEKNSKDIKLLQASFDQFKEKRKSHEIY